MSAAPQLTTETSALRVEAARLGLKIPAQYTLWLEQEVIRLRAERSQLLAQAKALAERAMK